MPSSLEEIREDKRILENEICSLIAAFEKKHSGTLITRAGFIRVDMFPYTRNALIATDLVVEFR